MELLFLWLLSGVLGFLLTAYCEYAAGNDLKVRQVFFILLFLVFGTFGLVTAIWLYLEDKRFADKVLIKGKKK